MKIAHRAAVSRVVMPLLSALSFVGRLGFGRQGALAATGRMFPQRALTPMRRAISLFFGSMFIGTGVALLTQAHLGLSPYDVLVSGLQPRIGLSFGQTVWLVSAVLFSVASILGERPSRWGIMFTLGNGLAIDAVSGSINAPESLLARSLFVGAALMMLATGISLVVHSGSTGGSFELLMKAGEVRGYNRRVVRTSLELSVFVLGITLGGSFGPATLAIAFGIGPLLSIMGQALNDHATGRAMRLIDESPESRHPSSVATRRR